MAWDPEQAAGLNIALNEATLLAFSFDPLARTARAAFEVFSLSEDGSSRSDMQVELHFSYVGRLAVSLRNGRWDDPSAPVQRLTAEQIADAVASFGQEPVYGAEFFDAPDARADDWIGRLSYEFSGEGPAGKAHTFTFFQEASDRHLDAKVWFGDLRLRGPGGAELDVDAFIGGGVRWWNALGREEA